MVLEQLSSSNKKVFEELLKRSKEFNQLNENFHRFYSNLDWIKLLRLKKKVFLFKEVDEYIGYIWTEETDYKVNKIYSLYIRDDVNSFDLNTLSKYFSPGHTFYYECRLNGHNKQILDRSNFIDMNHYIEMKYSLEGDVMYSGDTSEVSFKVLQEGKDEKLRCRLQNDIFNTHGRIPLTVKDIFNDEEQEYYLIGGGYFISHNKMEVGYGQLIKHDFPDSVLLVNFGVLGAKRKLGFGRLLLNFLLKEARDMGYKNVYLRVNINNLPAIKLYSEIGFITFSNVIHYEYKIR